MAKLPAITAQNLIQFFKAHGFQEKRRKGSHIAMKKPKVSRPIIIACHGRRIMNANDVMTNLRTASLTKEELVGFLRKQK